MIRQYMTTAAILAAGTMLAGAAVEGWTDATYTLVGNNSGGISSGNGVTAGRGAFATITVDEESLSTLSAADYSWQITFSVTAPNNSSFGMVYSSMGGGNGSGVALAVKYDGSQYTYELRSGSNGVGSKPALTSGSGTTSITTTSTDVTLTWDTDENTFTLGVGEEEELVYTGLTEDWFTLGTYTSGEIGAQNVGTDTKNGSVFWTNGGANSVTDITLSVAAAALPEPSAFGLLAGLGALALVASRRRRK